MSTTINGFGNKSRKVDQLDRREYLEHEEVWARIEKLLRCV